MFQARSVGARPSRSTFQRSRPSLRRGTIWGEAIGPSEGGNGRHVLVVEDNVGVGEFCVQVLDDMGFRTTLAVTAEDALAKLSVDGDGYDAVFSDVVMPGMGGVALAKVLRERMPAMPVLLTSGYSHVLAADDRHGFSLLKKPYSAEQLARSLNEILGALVGGRPSHRSTLGD